MTRRQVELTILKAGALRLAGLANLRRRVAIDHWHQLTVGLQIGDPAAANADKPEVSLSVERAPLEELALRRIVNVGEFLDRADPCRQRRQPPWLHRSRVGRLGRRLRRRWAGDANQSDRKCQ